MKALEQRSTSMSPVRYRYSLIAAVICGAVHPCGATPCDWVDRPHPYKQSPALNAELARQAGFKKVRVGESMHYRGWHIIQIVPDTAESEWLFYSRDPMGTHPITSWSGAVAPFEEISIQKWLLKNTPGIPLQLARCFAWRVTPVP